MTESTVERLRAGASPSPDVSSHLRKYQALCDEAAAEIDRLTAERDAARAEAERLREAGVIAEIAVERRRQIEVEGWTPEHDDQHENGEMTAAALGYVASALSVLGKPQSRMGNRLPAFWPWSRHWWKPTTPRRDLIKAAALIVAEIERLDRAALSQEPRHD